MITKELVTLKVADLIPYENNPRIHDKDSVAAIVESMNQCEPLQPIEIDENNVILAGHGRRLAHLKRGDKEVNVIRYIGLTEDQKQKYRILSNKAQEFSVWDLDKLDEELEGLDFGDFDWGFEMDEEEEHKEVEEDNFEVELPETPNAKVGDVYQLGNHILMCGDSTSLLDVQKLMGGAEADLVVTDPPYNMNYSGAGNTAEGKRSKNKIMNDNMSDADFDTFMTDIYTNIYLTLKEGASFYVFYKEMGKGVFLTTLQKSGLTYKQELIWVKNQIVLGGEQVSVYVRALSFWMQGQVREELVRRSKGTLCNRVYRPYVRGRVA